MNSRKPKRADKRPCAVKHKAALQTTKRSGLIITHDYAILADKILV